MILTGSILLLAFLGAAEPFPFNLHGSGASFGYNQAIMLPQQPIPPIPPLPPLHLQPQSYTNQNNNFQLNNAQRFYQQHSSRLFNPAFQRGNEVPAANKAPQQFYGLAPQSQPQYQQQPQQTQQQQQKQQQLPSSQARSIPEALTKTSPPTVKDESFLSSLQVLDTQGRLRHLKDFGLGGSGDQPYEPELERQLRSIFDTINRDLEHAAFLPLDVNGAHQQLGDMFQNHFNQAPQQAQQPIQQQLSITEAPRQEQKPLGYSFTQPKQQQFQYLKPIRAGANRQNVISSPIRSPAQAIRSSKKSEKEQTEQGSIEQQQQQQQDGFDAGSIKSPTGNVKNQQPQNKFMGSEQYQETKGKRSQAEFQQTPIVQQQEQISQQQVPIEQQAIKAPLQTEQRPIQATSEQQQQQLQQGFDDEPVPLKKVEHEDAPNHQQRSSKQATFSQTPLEQQKFEDQSQQKYDDVASTPTKAKKFEGWVPIVQQRQPIIPQQKLLKPQIDFEQIKEEQGFDGLRQVNQQKEAFNEQQKVEFGLDAAKGQESLSRPELQQTASKGQGKDIKWKKSMSKLTALAKSKLTNTGVFEQEQQREEAPLQQQREEDSLQQQREEPPLQQQREVAPIQQREEDSLQQQHEEASLQQQREGAPLQQLREEPPFQQQREVASIQQQREEAPLQQQREAAPIQQQREEAVMEPLQQQREKTSLQQQQEDTSLQQQQQEDQLAQFVEQQREEVFQQQKKTASLGVQKQERQQKTLRDETAIVTTTSTTTTVRPALSKGRKVKLQLQGEKARAVIRPSQKAREQQQLKSALNQQQLPQQPQQQLTFVEAKRPRQIRPKPTKQEDLPQQIKEDVREQQNLEEPVVRISKEASKVSKFQEQQQQENVSQSQQDDLPEQKQKQEIVQQQGFKQPQIQESFFSQQKEEFPKKDLFQQKEELTKQPEVLPQIQESLVQQKEEAQFKEELPQQPQQKEDQEFRRSQIQENFSQQKEELALQQKDDSTQVKGEIAHQKEEAPQQKEEAPQQQSQETLGQQQQESSSSTGQLGQQQETVSQQPDATQQQQNQDDTQFQQPQQFVQQEQKQAEGLSVTQRQQESQQETVQGEDKRQEDDQQQRKETDELQQPQIFNQEKQQVEETPETVTQEKKTQIEDEPTPTTTQRPPTRIVRPTSLRGDENRDVKDRDSAVRQENNLEVNYESSSPARPKWKTNSTARQSANQRQPQQTNDQSGVRTSRLRLGSRQRQQAANGDSQYTTGQQNTERYNNEGYLSAHQLLNTYNPLQFEPERINSLNRSTQNSSQNTNVNSSPSGESH